jgi:hypothetical protein
MKNRPMRGGGVVNRGDLDNRSDSNSDAAPATHPFAPAFASLVAAMSKLSRQQRIEVARLGRKARAAKTPRIRRLARAAAAEARLARELAQEQRR